MSQSVSQAQRSEALSYLHVGLVHALRRAGKRAGARVRWEHNDTVTVRCASGYVVRVGLVDDARAVLRALESGELR